jgi:hypothetical protein
MRPIDRPIWPTRRRKERERRNRKRAHRAISYAAPQSRLTYNTNPDAYRKATP